MKIKVLIVEDEPAIAHDIAFNLEDNDFIIAGIAHSSEKALELLSLKNIDIAMLDIHIKGTKTGIELAHIINEKYKLPFVFLTSFSDKDTIGQVANTSPYGYLVKPFKDNDLAPAIISAIANFNRNNNYKPLSLSELNKIALSPISKTEYVIIEYIWQGKTNQEISDLQFVSINTVKSQINNIFIKLDVHSKIQLNNKLRK